LTQMPCSGGHAAHAANAATCIVAHNTHYRAHCADGHALPGRIPYRVLPDDQDNRRAAVLLGVDLMLASNDVRGRRHKVVVLIYKSPQLVIPIGT
jgi:hypothetical protein